MKLRTIFCLVMLAMSGLTAVGKTAFPGSPGVHPVRNHSLLTGMAGVFSLTDFGAVGNGVADDGPALQNALNAIGAAGGGTLFVPAGRYAIITPVHKNFTGLASDVSILGVESSTPVPPPNSDGQTLSHGLDLTSEFAPRTGPQGIAINITGLQRLLIKDIVFIGTPGVETDALITLALFNIGEATIRHCEFYGLASLSPGGSIVQSAGSGLVLEQSVFLGCAANSGVNSPIVQNLEWKSITVTEAIFIDYGQRAELFGKLNLGAPFSWINVGNATNPQSDSPRREVVIRNVFLDEGGFIGLSSTPYRYLPVSAPIDLLSVSGLYMNVSNLGSWGNFLYGPERVLIENSHYGWSHNTDAAINLAHVGNAILDRVECVASADRIRADAETQKLTVIDSVYNHLDSLAQNTRVITTTAPDEDPVQYVRQQFSALLGRDPDPAAHFYWSDQILQCGDNLQCVGARRAALGAFLATAPQVRFAVSGQIVDQTGVGLAGVTVALSGSANVTAATDANGRYQFSNLPTSGVYTVIPSQSHYTLSPSSFQIVTPAGDQIFNFAVTLDRHAIAGQVADGAGNALANVTVTLSGSESWTAITGADGRYVFADLSAGGNYTVTPSKTSYTFSPANKTFNNLDAGQTQNFTGTLSAAAPNPIDDPQFFVRQHYLDFLNRAPDASGLAFWTNQITSCGTDAACIDIKRINVSAAFFLSIEFQETGYLVELIYKSAYGDADGTSQIGTTHLIKVPIIRLNELLADSQLIAKDLIVGVPGWQQLLENNKVAFTLDFVSRSRFMTSYPNTLTPTQFVNDLYSNAGVVPSPTELASVIGEFGGAPDTVDTAARARALRRVAENTTLVEQEKNKAFVLMQYFGYMRRNPDDTPDSDYTGYDFWLGKLTNFNGNFVNAEMVKSFLVSGEYRGRFGTP
jgi:hypothetical protein